MCPLNPTPTPTMQNSECELESLLPNAPGPRGVCTHPFPQQACTEYLVVSKSGHRLAASWSSQPDEGQDLINQAIIQHYKHYRSNALRKSSINCSRRFCRAYCVLGTVLGTFSCINSPILRTIL